MGYDFKLSHCLLYIYIYINLIVNVQGAVVKEVLYNIDQYIPKLPLNMHLCYKYRAKHKPHIDYNILGWHSLVC